MRVFSALRVEPWPRYIVPGRPWFLLAATLLGWLKCERQFLCIDEKTMDEAAVKPLLKLSL